MLKVKNSLPAQYIGALKLISGEEIIAHVTDTTDSHISLKSPLTLVMTMPESGSDQGQVAFAPWMLGLDGSQVVQLELAKVLFVGRARQDAATQYQEALGATEVH